MPRKIRESGEIGPRGEETRQPRPGYFPREVFFFGFGFGAAGAAPPASARCRFCFFEAIRFSLAVDESCLEMPSPHEPEGP
jgi:hypothetical protein